MKQKRKLNEKINLQIIILLKIRAHKPISKTLAICLQSFFMLNIKKQNEQNGSGV